MEFVTRLPSSNGFDAIWVVVKYLTKLQYFAPYSTTVDTEGLAEWFLTNVFCLHGLPDTILSD
jgi:hypothetical protein